MALFSGAQVTLLLQAVQQRVEGSGADPVPVPGQFLDHAEPKDRFLNRVMKDVQPNQAGIEIPILRNSVIGFRFRHSIMNTPV
jgi:hypothetical protein